MQFTTRAVTLAEGKDRPAEQRFLSLADVGILLKVHEDCLASLRERVHRIQIGEDTVSSAPTASARVFRTWNWVERISLCRRGSGEDTQAREKRLDGSDGVGNDGI